MEKWVTIIFDNTNCVIEKPRESPMESFMQPLRASLWLTLFTSVFIVGCAMYILDKRSPFNRFYRRPALLAIESVTLTATRSDDSLNFGEAMWFVWGVLLNSGVSESMCIQHVIKCVNIYNLETPRSFSARVLGMLLYEKELIV